jgi:hypothetical protein
MKQELWGGFEYENEGKYLRGRLRSQCCPGGENTGRRIREKQTVEKVWLL